MAWSPLDLPVQGEFAFLAPWGIPVAGRQKGEDKAAVSQGTVLEDTVLSSLKIPALSKLFSLTKWVPVNIWSRVP